MTDQYIQNPPDGFAYRGLLFEDLAEQFEKARTRLLVWANLMALIPLAVGIVLLWVPYQIYLAIGTPLALFPNPDWSLITFVIVGAMVIVGSMVLHELLHGLALLLSGYKPWFSIRMGVPHTGISKDNYLPRNIFIFVSLTPLMVMTIAGSAALLFLPSAIGQLVLIALLLNFAASIGDLIVTSRLLCWPPETRFADDEGTRVFVPLPVAVQAGTSPELSSLSDNFSS